ncbi:F-box/kelch-repeat protein [Arabidopsis thaliana]
MYISKTTRESREGESTIITLMNYKLCLMSLVVDVDPYIEHKGKLTCFNLEHQVKISQVFYYEGLLLCVLKDDTITTRLVVWNPYWGQTRQIKTRYSHHAFYGRDSTYMFNYSLGYKDKNSCRSHKLLRFIDYHRNYLGLHQFFWYEIYDFDSDLWTTLDVTPYWFIAISQSGVSLKGNTYWCARNRSSGYSDHIICFDFTRERFGPLLPLPFSFIDRHHSCDHYYKNVVEIWITAKLEAEMVSWSKFLRINTGPIIHTSFFINEEKKVAIGFNDNRKTINIIGEAGYLRELDLGEHAEPYRRRHVFSYAPSSVQIKETAPGNIKKHQSSLETRLFDRNMLRLVAFEKKVSE